MKLDLQASPYASKHRPIVARHGIVATSQILASQAGLRMFQAGGNAVDAIVAAAAAKTVVEPCSNGIGGDGFAIVWDGKKLHGLNGSGRAPKALTLERALQSANPTPDRAAPSGWPEPGPAMPGRGWLTVTVPGIPRTWADLHGKFGRLPFEQVLAPAIEYAEHGFAVSPLVHRAWAAAARAYSELRGPEFKPWFDTFTRDGVPPGVGDCWRLPHHAATLRRIAESKADDFYKGKTAEKIACFASDTGGLITKEDLEAHTSTWVDPIGTTYRGYGVWEIPPNGQGITALIALNILEGFEMGKLQRESVEAYHRQIEAMRLAFADARRYVADPAKAHVPIEGLLDKEYASERSKLIGERAEARNFGKPRGGTVYLCAADTEGLMVSYIQSNFAGFGSGVVVPEAGVALQNRGSGFSLHANHPNVVAPGKRPYHTIIPAFLTRDGDAVGPFGVMGGYMQPQGHAQMVLNTVDWGLNPQAALDAPRWQVAQGVGLNLEPSVPKEVAEGLAARGHNVQVAASEGFGRGQIIWKTESGGLVAGSEPRADGCALGY